MQHHGQSHVYRHQKDADRVIQMFGRKPSEQAKQKTRENLMQQKEKFQSLEQLRSREQQRQRGRGR